MNCEGKIRKNKNKAFLKTNNKVFEARENVERFGGGGYWLSG